MDNYKWHIMLFVAKYKIRFGNKCAKCLGRQLTIGTGKVGSWYISSNSFNVSHFSTVKFISAALPSSLNPFPTRSNCNRNEKLNIIHCLIYIIHRVVRSLILQKDFVFTQRHVMSGNLSSVIQLIQSKFTHKCHLVSLCQLKFVCPFCNPDN